MSRLRLIILTGLILAISATVVLAQDDITPVLKQAVAYLSKKLNKPIPSIDTYTYEVMIFADASLDCPEPGKVYSPGAIPGYKFLITVGGINYDVRISSDGTLATYCTGTVIKVTSSLATYRNPQYSVPYPDTWRVTLRDSDIYFGISQAPVCSQPGMIVTALGAVPDNKTPDSVLDDFAQNPNARGAKPEGDRSSLSSIGRSELFTAPCSDGSPRESRVSAFIAYGHAFRIWQFAPKSAFAQWADLYLEAAQGFSPAPNGAEEGHPITLPTHSTLAVLAHIFAGNVYSGTLTDLPGMPITTDAASDHSYSSVVVSSKGAMLAFVDPSNGLLYVSPAKTGPIRQLADKLAPGYPPAWKTDGSEIAYITADATTDPIAYQLMAVKADGSGKRLIAPLQGIKSDCSASTTDPAEQLYWSATGLNGNEVYLTWTSGGALYYSLGCDGVGVGQISDTGKNASVINASLRRVHLAPDGSQVLGILDNKLVVVKVSDHSLTEIPTVAQPDQSAWTPDGKVVYYSTATLNQPIKLDAEADKERGIKAFGVWPFESASYEVALHSRDLSGGTDTQLFKINARAIARIAPSPDNSGVLFTLVEDASALAQAFKNNESPGDMRREAPSTLLYWLALPTGQPQVLAVTLGQTWGPLGSAPAPTPTGAPASRLSGLTKTAAAATATAAFPATANK